MLPDLDTVADYFDRVLLLNRRIIAEGTMDELRARAEERDGAHLEDVFLSLVGSEDMEEVIQSLRL